MFVYLSIPIILVDKGDIVSVWVDLEGKCLKGWKKRFTGSSLFIGNGRCVADRSEIFNDQAKQGLVGVGVEMIETEYQMPPLNGVLSGGIFLQNLPSILTAKALNVYYSWLAYYSLMFLYVAASRKLCIGHVFFSWWKNVPFSCFDE